ncbi:hypothetical protein Kpho02_10430 [Kitasatospora phosalacinea]|uniref:DUF2617 domain-containing protein n=1 Tax=Kitasatospora phosalacinea TaxID=2065 RepID=A0A9W6Q2J5_9ACTN|nr:DUF2617 family protein [Kitasatospora phosalacinea]GLW68744.1 hypothetical protein Kpho02_10430 [Kitasatospora phosalacinea]
MLTTLQTSYTDTRAGDLAWQLGGEPLPALAVRDLRLDDASGAPDGLRGTLQLRLLGASHQVVLAAGPGDCLETVACLPGRRTPLPARVAEQVAGWEYEFAARIEELPPHVFEARAQELLALVQGHPRALAGVFPGDPSAFTALVAHCEDRRVHWRTWHAYPQEGRLVCTRSSLSLPGTGRPETARAAGTAAAGAPTGSPAQVGW